jgi:hypothetical protein
VKASKGSPSLDKQTQQKIAQQEQTTRALKQQVAALELQLASLLQDLNARKQFFVDKRA